MFENLIYFFIGISLSIDAFSVAISIGAIIDNIRKILYLPVMVGIFHFFMPLIGLKLGNLLIKKILINTNYIIFMIFLILSITLVTSKENDKNISQINLIKCIIISLLVSLDSLSVGFALGLSEISAYRVSIIISMVSTISTFIGIILGKKVKEMYNNKAKYIGAIILFIIAIKYLIH